MGYRGSSARLTTGANSAPLQGGGNFIRRFGTKIENQPNGNFGDVQPTQSNQPFFFGNQNVPSASVDQKTQGFIFGSNPASGQQKQNVFFNDQPATDQSNMQEFGVKSSDEAIRKRMERFGLKGSPAQFGLKGDPAQFGLKGSPAQFGLKESPAQFGLKGSPAQFGKKPEGVDSSDCPDRFTRTGYVPKDRKIDEIQKEDDLVRGLYSMVFETDENVLVTGVVDNITVINSWNQIGLDPNVMQNINRSGYIHPRKIQAYAIPLIIQGYDLKAQAETGSGKSAAFLIPLINKIIDDKKKNPISGVNNKPFAIIMEPTRELALQLYDQARKIAFNTGVRVVKAYGQYQVTANGKEIMEGSDIVIGTPGRLLHFIENKTVNVEMLKYFVLDEADRLISDSNFNGIVQKIRSLPNYPKKEDVQNLLFSATFPEEVETLANDLLKSKRAFLHNELTVAVNPKITQEFIECPENEKKIKVLEFLKDDLKYAQAINPNAKQSRTLIFVRKRSTADLVCLFLCDSGIRATTINGDRPQKERELALEYFRSNETPVLVSTDVCARGLDIKDLDCVINMDLPDRIDTYVHRIGRTGRLKAGRALSFFNESTDHQLASSLVKLLEESNSPNIPAFLRDSKSSQAPPSSTNDFSSQQQTSGFGQDFGAQQTKMQQQTNGFVQGFGSQQQFGGYGDQIKSGGFGSQQSGASNSFGAGFGSQQKSGYPDNQAFGSGKWPDFGSAR